MFVHISIFTLPTIIYMIYINHSGVVKNRFFFGGGANRGTGEGSFKYI